MVEWNYVSIFLAVVFVGVYFELPFFRKVYLTSHKMSIPWLSFKQYLLFPEMNGW